MSRCVLAIGKPLLFGAFSGRGESQLDFVGRGVSDFEWVQDIASFFWSEDEINVRLDRIMNEAFATTWAIAEEKKVSLCTAAHILGCRRIFDARRLRGL